LFKKKKKKKKWKMENLTQCEINNPMIQLVSVNAVATTKIAGIRIRKKIFFFICDFHTIPMTSSGLKTSKKTSFPSVQTKTYAAQASSITLNTAYLDKKKMKSFSDYQTRGFST